jgi:hypothetical protein
MAKKKIEDAVDFHDISVTEKNDGVLIEIGHIEHMLNREDAQFLCDALYVLIDDMYLTEEENNEKSNS